MTAARCLFISRGGTIVLKHNILLMNKTDRKNKLQKIYLTTKACSIHDSLPTSPTKILTNQPTEYSKAAFRCTNTNLQHRRQSLGGFLTSV